MQDVCASSAVAGVIATKRRRGILGKAEEGEKMQAALIPAVTVCPSGVKDCLNILKA